MVVVRNIPLTNANFYSIIYMQPYKKTVSFFREVNVNDTTMD